jgi:hypothetical protein
MSELKNAVADKNCTTTPLLADTRWRGISADALHYDTVTVSLSADQDATLSIVGSVDGSIVTTTDTYAYIAEGAMSFSTQLKTKYFRVELLCGSTSMTELNLQTIMRVSPAMPTSIEVSGSVTIEPGASDINVVVTNNELSVGNGLKPFEFIPTAFNSIPEIYADGQQPYITPYGLWGYTNTNPEKINWYIYRTLKQTDLSLSSIRTCYMTIENLSDTSAYPYMAVYSLPSGTGDAEAWYKSKWVFENTDTPINTGEKVLLYFGQEDDANIEPGIRHIEMPLNSAASDGPQDQYEQLMFVTIQTASGESTGAYNFEFSKFGINWTSYGNEASGQKPQGVMIQNDLSELVVSNAPNPSNALKPYRNINVGLTASNIKLGPTWIHTINTSNDDNQHLFLKLYSSTTQPNETSTPVWTVRVHQNQSNDINFNVSLYSELGFWVRCSTGVLDDDIGAPSTNGCIFNCAYF